MSVVSVVEKVETRNATSDVKGRRTYTLNQWVTTDNPSDNEAIIKAAPGIAHKYDPHPADAGALAKDIAVNKIAELAKGGAVWEVITHYDSEFSDSPDEHPDQDVPNPLDRPTIFTWGGAIYTESQDQDLDGLAYVNTAGAFVGDQRMGDPFDPAPLVEVVHGIITATRNVAVFNEARAEYYRNKVNSDTWRGHKKDTAKVAVYGAQGPLFENNVEFYSETIEIHTNPSKWIPWSALNRGPRVLEGGEPTHPPDKDGVKSTVQVKIAEDGTLLADGAAPWFIDFRQYERAPFSALDLD